MIKIWTTDEIKVLINTSPKAVSRGILALYNNQTQEEKLMGASLKRNGTGFNKRDACYGTELALQIIDKKPLSQQQIYHARRMLKKYVGQLTEIANSRKE
ncbi:hypothetical protein KKH23_09955 [Patescibacteria group bacterium]|nr:hypothetical protein [Patescibacteria group bacterium]